MYPAGVSGDIVTATTELSSWIENATGVDIGITTDEGLSYTSSSKYISLGDTAVAAAAQVALDEDVDVGFSGFQIKTKGESVFVLGETGSGVLFGTYELLYRLIGFVTYSGDEIYYESKTQVPLYDFDITDIPDFEYRVTAYGLSTYNAALANRLRYNQQEDVWIPVDGYNWHNTLKYLPPDDHKDAHPRWYDNKDNPQQLCFLAHGDTEEADALYETLLNVLIGYLDQYPERNNITITQEDVNVWCECEACNKQQEKYGTDAATIVQFCNRISEGVEAHYAELGQTRDINICFFAYHKTESAPVTLVDGEYVPVHCMKENYRGAWGYMRCSHRELDPKWSSDFQPVQAHRKEEPMEPGKVYEVDVEIWPHSRVWHKGEIIRLEIAGQFIRTDWYEDNSMAFDVDNGSQCVIHTGGKYASYLQIPFIPPKYKSGDYVYED